MINRFRVNSSMRERVRGVASIDERLHQRTDSSLIEFLTPAEQGLGKPQSIHIEDHHCGKKFPRRRE